MGSLFSTPDRTILSYDDALARLRPEVASQWREKFQSRVTTGQQGLTQATFTTLSLPIKMPPLEQSPIAAGLFCAFDANGDGIISEEEYLATIAIFLTGTRTEKLKFVFHVYDQDRAGSISKSQLVTIYCRVLTAIGTPIPLARKAHGEAHAREAFAKYDVNGDELLSFLEFEQYVLHDPWAQKHLQIFPELRTVPVNEDGNEAAVATTTSSELHQADDRFS